MLVDLGDRQRGGLRDLGPQAQGDAIVIEQARLVFSADDHARGVVIERLMCDFRVDFGAIAAHYFGHSDYFDDALTELDALAAQNVLRRDQRVVEMTESGRPFVRLAAAAFDAYLEHNKARHSVAI